MLLSLPRMLVISVFAAAHADGTLGAVFAEARDAGIDTALAGTRTASVPVKEEVAGGVEAISTAMSSGSEGPDEQGLWRCLGCRCLFRSQQGLSRHKEKNADYVSCLKGKCGLIPRTQLQDTASALGPGKKQRPTALADTALADTHRAPTRQTKAEPHPAPGPAPAPAQRPLEDKNALRLQSVKRGRIRLEAAMPRLEPPRLFLQEHDPNNTKVKVVVDAHAPNTLERPVPPPEYDPKVVGPKHHWLQGKLALGSRVYGELKNDFRKKLYDAAVFSRQQILLVACIGSPTCRMRQFMRERARKDLRKLKHGNTALAARSQARKRKTAPPYPKKTKQVRKCDTALAGSREKKRQSRLQQDSKTEEASIFRKMKCVYPLFTTRNTTAPQFYVVLHRATLTESGFGNYVAIGTRKRT